MENVLKIWQECNRCVYVDLDDGSKFEFIYGFFSSKRDEGFIQIWYFYRNGECHREDLTSNVSTYEVKRLGRCGNSPALECFERLDEEAREKVKKFIPEKLSYLLDVGLRLLNSIGERVLDKYEKEMEMFPVPDDFPVGEFLQSAGSKTKKHVIFGEFVGWSEPIVSIKTDSLADEVGVNIAFVPGWQNDPPLFGEVIVEFSRISYREDGFTLYADRILSREDLSVDYPGHTF
jgi:hypothetical protein